jgi:hypothetical protein
MSKYKFTEYIIPTQKKFKFIKLAFSRIHTLHDKQSVMYYICYLSPPRYEKQENALDLMNHKAIN